MKASLRSTLAALAGASLLALGGCASTQLEAQWKDPASARILSGSRVLVACDAFELVVRKLCEDKLSAEVRSRGATPVLPPADTQIATDRAIDGQLLPAARNAGARSMLVVTLAVAATDVSQPFSIGIGGFGFGSRSGGGVGVGIPVGGGRVSTGYSANGRVTAVADGRLVWTAKATTPPSSDLDAQLSELSKAVVDAAATSGLF
jgi:hypothetical protein